MGPFAFKAVYLFLALVALPQALAGPGCARRNYGKQDCVEKCRNGWGASGHYMGRNKWGSVMNRSDDTDLDSIVAAACGLNQTTTPDPEPTSTDIPCSSSSSPPPANGYESTPSVPNPGPSSSTSPPPDTTPTSSSTSSTPTNTPQSFRSSPHQHGPPPSSSSSPSPTPPAPSPSPSPSPSPDSSPVPSPSPSPSPAANNSTQKVNSNTSNSFESDALSGHNSYRQLHGASALTWSDDLANTAASWVSGCVFKHSGGQYGENIAAGTGTFTVTDAINAWTSESTSYDPNNPVASHFTQVVWKGSTQLGCAVFTCAPGTIFDASFGDAQFIACEYNPPGNVDGQYAQNVQA